ncbi:hypothetical protein BC938DRAFT_474970, partial [Jimgerdemannia flammicorona]
MQKSTSYFDPLDTKTRARAREQSIQVPPPPTPSHRQPSSGKMNGLYVMALAGAWWGWKPVRRLGSDRSVGTFFSFSFFFI